jgi:hypothetical protein
VPKNIDIEAASTKTRDISLLTLEPSPPPNNAKNVV